MKPRNGNEIERYGRIGRDFPDPVAHIKMFFGMDFYTSGTDGAIRDYLRNFEA